MTNNLTTPGDMEDLKRYKEELKKKSEANMKSMLNEAIKQNKLDMNENMETMFSTMKNSIDSVKLDLAIINQKYNTRLEQLDNRVTKIDQKMDNISADDRAYLSDWKG